MARIAINGFGRIGRCIMRGIVQNGHDDLEVVAINDLTDARTLAHLLKYDSIHGRIGSVEVTAEENAVVVGGRKIPIIAETDPAKLPWKEKKVDIVFECTGRFTKRPDAAKHLDAGAGHVIISAPATEPDITACFGINHQDIDPAKHRIISNASCTTNCLAPVAKVLNDTFGIEHALMTTIHAYTNDQRLLDLPHKDLRRARAAALSMIPTSTGAAKAVGLVLPELSGKLNGVAIRVPTPNVSMVDLTARLEKSASVDDINAAFKKAAEGPMKGVLAYADEPTVSIDYSTDPHSSIYDSLATQVLGDRFVKVFAWYDNEWGFSMRMIDMAKLVAG
jgi:glyceraldehyde 3-phosphate dehydrogenase